MCCSYSNTSFGGVSTKIYKCYEQKTAFVMQNFLNLGPSGGENFSTKPPKGTSLPDSRILSHRSCKSIYRFFSRRAHEKGTLQKVTERLYFTYLWGISIQRNSTKIGIWEEVADVISQTKFGNDRSREYKVTEVWTLPCSIGLTCCL